jgi:uncharacterized protein (DUF169 family)
MGTVIEQLQAEMVAAMGVKGLSIPLTAVKFFGRDESVPDAVMDHHPAQLTLTSCQATRQAALGDPVCLTKDNIGCVAAAITFGLVDARDGEPLEGPRAYTDIMRENARDGDGFAPPCPRDFTEGLVYACRDAGRPEFSLFGSEDSGRFKDVETARRAVAGMAAIQPPTMRAVFAYPADFTEVELVPDVVVLSVRPVELARIVQAHQFATGERVEASMGAVRVVNSDLIVRPFLSGRMNVSTYCIGARLIARYEADRMGVGMPLAVWEKVVAGMEESATGYPFALYPGAAA